MIEEEKTALKQLIAKTSYQDLVDRQDYIKTRLDEISIDDPFASVRQKKKKGNTSGESTSVIDKSKECDLVPYDPKTDVHWDFVMKEMQWLSTDFQSERKRQMSLAKKQSMSIGQFHANKEKRKLRLIAEMELRKRRLASKMARDVVKGWWNAKIERVIAYKQKVDADLHRKRGMDKHLLFLVKQTERYTGLLNEQLKNEGCENQINGTKVSIEEALQQESEWRRASRSVHRTDYQRLANRLEGSESEFYGESTEDEGESEMEDYKPDLNESEDDETTLLEAERDFSQDEAKREVDLLMEESEMDIEELLKRFEAEREKELHTLPSDAEMSKESKALFDHSNGSKVEPRRQKVRFSNDVSRDGVKTVDGNMADDDADMSDVDDFDNKSDGSDEFEANEDDDVDDMTTFEAELKMKPEIDPIEEVALLEKEAEMSIDELRAMYGAMEQSNESSLEEDSGTSGSEEFEDDHNEIDDETTIEAEEKLGRDMSYEDEIALLKKESEMSVDELRQKYAAAFADKIEEDTSLDDEEANENETESSEDTKNIFDHVFEEGNEKDQEEYQPKLGSDLDDETTLEAEEKLGREISYEEEIALLQKENEMSIEDLRAMYYRNSDDQESSVESNENELSKKRKQENSSDLDNKRLKVSVAEDEDVGANALKSLEIADAKARNTMVSRPYLLPPWVKLREYQQIGLNWLVSIQTRRLNGILADEMGLGKTLQTISLLSYLAAYKGIWGPHLIIVPTSCIVNWEVEIKRFCPAFKVLCYYGSAKRRKELRQGWTKTNWHHIIITSYQLVVQDSFAFKRKKWYYMVLDEAHNIKNFQSQRWQTLINFNTQRRLLLTGTPLQNNLMELWSLLHFLMPHVFRSRKEFSHWFSNPMNNIIEGNSSRNDDLITRLHGIIRPFVLRRLKKDVETQMPGKYEHIVKCHLSRRQMFLYEEFMSRSSTRMAMQKGGNYMGMMNVLMQLRKVCNHPDLFEPRSIVAPFSPEPLSLVTASCVVNALEENDPLKNVSSFLTNVLWSFGCGLPSVDTSLKHDSFISCRKNKLQIDKETLMNRFANDDSITEPRGIGNKNNGLIRLLDNIWTESKAEREDMAKSRARLNAFRCDVQSFPFPSSLQDAIFISRLQSNSPDTYGHISCTPTELIKMKRLQQDLQKEESDALMKSFVFYVSKAGVQPPKLFPNERSSKAEPLIEEIRSTCKNSNQLFFPDKKLVQFDAGKLQILAELLRNLKRERHRVLIFTQMSKMLDILEGFLNLNGHTYLRLDGATGVDQRQRLMDRFNNDEKIFCFILSTRSGGLGINLTGADTVIFYDSDWNPAMDAQAQDRAHRIGQTRDVHIYRLVTEHTIEENILVKAKQKRHLDFLVMDEGKFHAAPPRRDISESSVLQDSEVFDVSTKTGLRNILGVNDQGGSEEGQEVSEEQFVSAMAEIEDEDDIKALRGAQQEAKKELEEFDESIQYKKDEEDAGDSQDENEGDIGNHSGTSDSKKSEAENQAAILEKEFQEWQSKLGADKASIDACLNPVERYALRFKEDIDPFYSMWYLSEQQRMNEIEANREDEWDIDMIEALKAEEEQYAIEEGDLLATQPDPSDLSRQRYLYFREKGRLLANKRRRKLSGENWCTKIDGRTNLPFWYNIDSGEATWDVPKIITELKEYELADNRIWNGLPMKPLLHVMEYLVPYPERIVAGGTCKQWQSAAQNPYFVKHVYPVEMGALNMDPTRMERYHYRTITEALQDALPGDTIELGDGHYWINENELQVNVPLRFIGDDKDASHVVIEMSGTLIWKASKGFIEGVTLRRPRVGDFNRVSDILKIENQASLIIVRSAIDSGVKDMKDVSRSVTEQSAITVSGKLSISESSICNAVGRGIKCLTDSNVSVRKCEMTNNVGGAIGVNEGSAVSCDDFHMIHTISPKS